MATKEVDEVLTKHTKTLMTIPGVVGTGEGRCEGKPCIKVFVIKKTSDLDEKIPKNLDGYEVIIEEVGEIKPLRREKTD